MNIEIPATMAEIDTLVCRVASKYKRRIWWASVDDMKQCAWQAVIECARHFDPQVGVPFLGYAHRAASIAVYGLVMRDSAPVSAGRAKHRLHKLKGLVRAPEQKALAEPSRAVSVDTSIDACRWQDRFDDTMRRVGACVDGRDIVMARCVLFEEVAPRIVANAFKTDVREVYAAVRQTKMLMAENLELFQLAQELEK